MSSVVRAFKEPTPVAKRFTVLPYYGFISDGAREYYFTAQDNTLHRIEADLSGNYQWVVARDMGKEMTITDIDSEIKEFWGGENGWYNISVIRPGRARKFQALSIPSGNFNASQNNGPAWNSAAYIQNSGDQNIPYFNRENNSEGINDLLQMGYGATTISNNYNQNLPFATFWAVTDPIIIKYDFSDTTYTRAIVNRVTEC
jgi:hypothetical protein